jgi:hypothetical protein
MKAVSKETAKEIAVEMKKSNFHVSKKRSYLGKYPKRIERILEDSKKENHLEVYA